jgi:hypothetical protein
MTISPRASHPFARRPLLAGALLLVTSGIACAWQAAPPPPRPPAPVLILPQSPAVSFQQVVQQQQLRDQLQQSQLSQQLQQNVADNARLPLAQHPHALQQADQADDARRARARALQQDLLQRAQDEVALPRYTQRAYPAPVRHGGR